jgi:superfamily I DNA/RNA helicase
VIRVIRAAAGCGKTTALAQAYLELVASGLPVERIVAITFTRRAAAELVQRVGLALRAASGDRDAITRLGETAPLYLASAPSDPEVALQALADLGSAPIGTTDHFVNQLLAEFALDAELPLPDGRTVPLDTGLVAVPELSAHLDASARRLVDPPEGDPPDEVSLLTRYFTLGEIVASISRTDDADGHRVAGCDEVLRWLAARVAELLEQVDLPAAFKVPPHADRDVWQARLVEVTNKGGEWAIPFVAAWLADGAPPATAPYQLLPWIRKLHQGRVRAVANVLKGAAFDFGITRVRMDHVLAALKHPYEDPNHLALADELRAAMDRLRVRVVADALEQAALQGELSHRELTRSAAHLARSQALVDRFGALLVDEFQDASPDQLELYEAMARLPRMKAVFVGDGRQSIYLFRGGEPEGLERLTTSTGPEHVVENLMVNRRSTPALVEAHRVMFAALDVPMRAEFYAPPEALEGLEADPARKVDALDPGLHAHHAPVVLVSDRSRKLYPNAADEAALTVFWDRVQTAWAERPSDSAAVLCPTWRSAIEARDRIRALAGDDGAAWVQGGDGWVEEGVGRDAALWLRALLDRTDDVAWLAVWKHPSIGLSDAAFARVKQGVGLVPDHGWNRQLGLLTGADRLEAPHRADDIAAFEAAVGPLREALATIGRDDTSLVLDRLFTALRWRTVLAAGPGGTDDVARLEVLLDWVGELDAQGAGVDAITATLGASNRMEVPRVRLDRPSRTVLCTTVFQSKGLAWDHVLVLSPGRSPRLDIDPELDGWMLLDGERVRLAGLKFDPEGGLVPYFDPLRRLVMQIHATRFAEEGARLAYVAVTRARRSVTIGLPNTFRRSSPMQPILATTWARAPAPVDRPRHGGPSGRCVGRGPRSLGGGARTAAGGARAGRSGVGRVRAFGGRRPVFARASRTYRRERAPPRQARWLHAGRSRPAASPPHAPLVHPSRLGHALPWLVRAMAVRRTCAP